MAKHNHIFVRKFKFHKSMFFVLAPGSGICESNGNCDRCDGGIAYLSKLMHNLKFCYVLLLMFKQTTTCYCWNYSVATCLKFHISTAETKTDLNCLKIQQHNKQRSAAYIYEISKRPKKTRSFIAAAKMLLHRLIWYCSAAYFDIQETRKWHFDY